MRRRFTDDEVREIAAEVAVERIRTTPPDAVAIRGAVERIVAERLQTDLPSAVNRQVTRIAEEQIRRLDDLEKSTRASLKSGVHHSPELKMIVREEAADVVRREIRDMPRMNDVEQKIRSFDLKRIATEEAAVAAAAETKRLLEAEYQAAVEAMVEEIVRESIEETVRSHAEREFARCALPRLLDVSVNDGEKRTIDGDTHDVLPDLLLTLGAGCHVLLVGPAGTGKSTMAKQAAQALGLTFHAMSVGPTTPTSKMFGYQDAHGNYHRTPLREAYENGGLMLLDELDNGHPGLLAELNQALSLDVCAFPDGMIERHERFRLVATANTYGHGGERQYVGRQALDAATLDRFLIVDVPVDAAMERRVMTALAPNAKKAADQFLSEIQRLRTVASEKNLPVIFSPRASIHAARLLEAGAAPVKVRQWCIVRGLSEAHRTALGIRDTP